MRERIARFDRRLPVMSTPCVARPTPPAMPGDDTPETRSLAPSSSARAWVERRLRGCAWAAAHLARYARCPVRRKPNQPSAIPAATVDGLLAATLPSYRGRHGTFRLPGAPTLTPCVWCPFDREAAAVLTVLSSGRLRYRSPSETISRPLARQPAAKTRLSLIRERSTHGRAHGDSRSCFAHAGSRAAPRAACSSFSSRA